VVSWGDWYIHIGVGIGIHLNVVIEATGLFAGRATVFSLVCLWLVVVLHNQEDFVGNFTGL
jgi:hypothetical protein